MIINKLLLNAIKHDNIDKVKKLVENGANVNYFDELPISKTILGGKYEIFKYLVEHNANIEKFKHNFTILFCLKNKYYDLMFYFIENSNEFDKINNEIKEQIKLIYREYKINQICK